MIEDNSLDLTSLFEEYLRKRKRENDSVVLLPLFLSSYELVKDMPTEKNLSAAKRKSTLTRLMDLTVGEHEFYKKVNDPNVIIPTAKQLSVQISQRYLSIRVMEENGLFSKGLKGYDHLVSTLSMTTSILESINEPLSKNDPNFSLMNDLFQSVFTKIMGFTKMLILGLFLDCYVAWRTIHESESTLILLVNNGDETKYSYVRHIVYSNLYYTPEKFDENIRNSIFDNEIKVEMNEHGLKSKDMKKFLEYGWLYYCKEYDMEKHPKFKLNFNDGVDELAGLRDEYNEFYKGTSEISHSSSIFFYANEEEIKKIALMLTYESSHRVFNLYLQFMKDYFDRNQDQKAIAENAINEVKVVSEHLRRKYDAEMDTALMNRLDREE